MIYQEYINDISLGVIQQNLLLLIFLIQIFSQLEQKWQLKPVEDHKKTHFDKLNVTIGIY